MKVFVHSETQNGDHAQWLRDENYNHIEFNAIVGKRIKACYKIVNYDEITVLELEDCTCQPLTKERSVF